LVWKCCRKRKLKNKEDLAERLTALEDENEGKETPVNFMYEEKGQKGALLNATNNTTIRSSVPME